MRCIFLVPLLLLAACGRDDAEVVRPTEEGSRIAVYAAQGRDRLCLSAAPGAFIRTISSSRSTSGKPTQW